MKNLGKLYGIGVGPGDPELISLKAVKVLNRVSVVYSAYSTKNSYSLAKEIVSPHIRDDVPVVRLDFPMTRDKTRLEEAWAENAKRIMATLKQGDDAAFITLGDPMIYSTFGYIMRAVKRLEPEAEIVVIPGISSYQAAAAATGRVLAEAEGSFTIISGAMGAERLKHALATSDTVIMLKVYKQYREILETLEQMDLIENSVLISKCGLSDEKIVEDLSTLDGFAPPYLSLLIIKKE